MELLKQPKIRQLALALSVVIPLEILSFFSIHLPAIIEYPLFLGLIYTFGKDVIWGGIQSLLRLRFSNINLLMTVATIGAVYLGELEEAVIIIVLFAVSEALEEFGINKSQHALEALVAKTPKTAQVLGEKARRPVEEISLDEIVVVKPGDYIPLDGLVVKGESLVDESSITGEPLPKTKFIGELVFAGTLNNQGYLEIKVTKTSKDTTLAKIAELTFQAAERKSQITKFIEKFAQIYTPTVFVISLLLTIIPVVLLGQPFQHWFIQSLTILLIACPCALVISTPISVFSAIGNASKRGVVIKGGQFLEEIGKVRAIAFDKTRTLTMGEPQVVDIVPLNGYSKSELLACVAGAEAFSEHPIAKSIVDSAQTYSKSQHEYQNFKAQMGKGISGDCLVCVDKHHCIGSLQFVMEDHPVNQKVIDLVGKFETEGKTAIVVSDNKKVKGVLSIVDALRPESQATISQLHSLGVKTAMLTGDNDSAAQAVAHELGIDTVYARLLPEQKVDRLQELKQKHQSVAMVGDGVNDAPSLTTASVGIAMGAVGSEVAIENADIALMNNNLRLIPFLISLGKRTTQTIQLNTTAAVGVKLFFLILALVGKSNLALAVFADVGVTLLVVVHSLRLFNFEMKTT